MNWKEQFEKKLGRKILKGNTLVGKCPDCKFPEVRIADSDIPVRETFIFKEAIQFISTEIIEKLIADIPDYDNHTIYKDYRKHLKQQLRDKWL